MPALESHDAARSAGTPMPRDEGTVDIRSTQAGYSNKTRSGRARDAAPTAPVRPATTPASAAPDAAPVDRVELSPAARELSARLASGPDAAGDLSADRLRELTGRMQSGYYARSEVVDRVLQGALTELTRDPAQG